MNIFQVLGKLTKKEFSFYTKGTDADRKGVVPLVIMRWMTGTSNRAQILSLNEIVNPYVFSLYKHPNLLIQLIAAASAGTPQKYSWLKIENRQYKQRPQTELLYKEVYGYSSKKFKQIETLLKYEDVVALAEQVGWQVEDINKIAKEWGNKPTKVGSVSKHVKPTEVEPTSTSRFDISLLED